MKTAAGLVLYRRGASGWEVLLIHASGNYNRGKPWSIPKGETDPGETDMQVTARREVREETGVDYKGPVVPLGTVQYKKSRKIIHAFAAAAPEDAKPHCASWEVDSAEFVPLEEARKRLHPDQMPFLERLMPLLESSHQPES
jgi:predicted NUDIX family NTP pyrophosphohydrolase